MASSEEGRDESRPYTAPDERSFTGPVNERGLLNPTQTAA